MSDTPLSKAVRKAAAFGDPNILTAQLTRVASSLPAPVSKVGIYPARLRKGDPGSDMFIGDIPKAPDRTQDYRAMLADTVGASSPDRSR